MRRSGFAYILGMFLILLGERIFGGDDPTRYGLSGVGVLIVLAALGLAATPRNRRDSTPFEATHSSMTNHIVSAAATMTHTAAVIIHVAAATMKVVISIPMQDCVIRR